MKKFRVYALIHGQTIIPGKVSDCEIRFMTYGDQSARNFTPIESKFSEDREEYKSYATNLPFIDPMKLKTEHVIVYDIEEHDAKAAICGAIRKFDFICSRLFIAGVNDMFEEHGRYIGNTYLYQVNKIYELSDSNTENEIEIDLTGGRIFLPNRPDRDKWLKDDSDKVFKEMLDFKDATFNKALKYLYNSSVGTFRLSSYEKIALDHFKSIEIIVNTLVDKDSVKKFETRAEKAGSILGLDDETVEKIKKYWKDRSNGDIAHSVHRDETAWYPNQFPLPSGMGYVHSHTDSVSQQVLIKYYKLRRRYYIVEIETPHDEGDENTLGTINHSSECNHLFFYCSKSKTDLLPELRKIFANEYQVDEGILEVKYLGTKKRASVFIKDDIEVKSTPLRGQIRIGFGR